MTDSRSTPLDQASQTPDQTRRRRFAFALWLLPLCLALVLGAIVWLAMTESGARTSLPWLGRFAGIHIQGISGNLINTLRIQRIDLQSKDGEFSANDVEVRWRPSALIRRQILLDYLRVGSIDIALAPSDSPSTGLPASLQLPGSIQLVRAEALEVRQLLLSDLEANHQRSHPQQFTALQGAIEINADQYRLQLQAATPWGEANMAGNLGTKRPFALHAQIGWTGLPIHDDALTVGTARLTGQLSGNLSRITLVGQLDASRADQNTKPAVGHIEAAFTPFSALPVDSIKLDLDNLNPTSFYKTAPKARLHVNADLKLGGDSKSPVLRGQLLVGNAEPAPWNLGGVPVVQLRAMVALSEHEVSWRQTRIDFEQSGYAIGEGKYAFPESGEKFSTERVALPELTVQFQLSHMNLLRIDHRLKRTSLSGTVNAKNENRQLQIGFNLQETGPALVGQLSGVLNLNDRLTLQTPKLLLSAKDTSISVSGDIALRGTQEFHVTGEAHNFDPSRWIDVPNGHIAARFNVAGQLRNGWRVEAQVSELSGQFAGSDLHGESDLNIQQNESLSIKKLEFDWGKNHLSAHGKWQMQSHGNPASHEQLQFVLAVPDLSVLSRPFEKILPVALQGSIFADGALSGNGSAPGGTLHIEANRLAVPEMIYIDNLKAHLALEEGEQGKMNGNVKATGVTHSGPSDTDVASFNIQRLEASIDGFRHAHAVQLQAFLAQQQTFEFRGEGNLQNRQTATDGGLQWTGNVLALNLSGPLDFQLQSSFNVQLSEAAVHIGEASWQGKLGKLHIQQLEWTPGLLKTTGQFQDIPLANVVRMWRYDSPVDGNLLLDANWQVNVGEQVSGQVEIRRSSGDLTVQDSANGHTQSIALGLEDLMFAATITDAPDHHAHQQLNISAQAKGNQLGLINGNLQTYLTKTAQGWQLVDSAALLGQSTLEVKDISWMSQLMGPGISIRGELNGQAEFHGVVGNPQIEAKIKGRELQLMFSDMGIVLPHGILDATIVGSTLTLTTLKFTNSIKPPPRHENLTDLNWLSQIGYIESTGVVDLKTARGSITTKWQKFPLMQSQQAWLVASGQAQLAESEKTWNLTGQLVADAAYFSVPKQAAPKLSADVVVLKSKAKRNAQKTEGLQTSLDFSIGTGKNFIFVGRGLDTRLDGDIRIRSKNGSSLLATGSIQTIGGVYEGYGQQLAIDRGILNFQGPIDNPGLNVRAIRRGLAVEAGVEVDGTVAKPTVHLISEPNVPDPDKLSWMVLGRPSDQMAGSEATLLMTAAGAIFGGDNGSNIPANIAHSLGLGDVTFGTTSASPESQLPTQTVAGTINTTAPTDQVFSVGKRIAPNIVFSIERSLTDASNGLKLTWQLTRRFSIIGRAGSDTAIDGQYTISFD